MNMFKLGALGALMVLGSSVYGMSKDTELTQSLMQNAQPMTPVATPPGSTVATPQSTPEKDIESGEIIAKPGYFDSFKSRVGGWLKPCKEAAKKCWTKRGSKDAAKLLGLSALNLGMWVYTTYANNPSVANIFAFTVVGTGSAAITADYDWISKIVADLLVFGGYAGLRYGADVIINPILCAGLGYAVAITLGDYGVMSGLINTEYAKYYQSLPEDMQKTEAERLAAEGRRIKAIMRQRGQDHMVVEMVPVAPVQH